MLDSSIKTHSILHIFTTIFFLQQLLVNSLSLSSCDIEDKNDVIFSFPTFNTSSCKPGGGLLCMGAVTPGEGFLNLTTAASSNNSSTTSGYMSFARVLYHRSVQIWPASFCTSFSFIIYPHFNQLNLSGDGMTFVMAQDDKSPSNNSAGSYLGLQDPLQGNTRFKQLAIEFDTFMNEWDPDGNHIGIDSLSAMNPLKAKTLNSSSIDLKSEKQIKVKINYNGQKKELQIYVGYQGKPLESFLNYSIKVSKYLPRNVYIGFTASTGLLSETHQLHDWVFTSKILSNKKNSKKLYIIIFASVIPLLVGFVLLALIVIPVIRCRIINKREMMRRKEELDAASSSAPRMFTYKQLARATNNFSHDNLLGSGGFGSVYEGHLVDPPQTIAVKKISASSQQGEREYLAEICTIGRLRHRNLLQLQGWCHENDQLLLVYDFMANKSLNKFLTGQSFLDWETRCKILTGLASALLYLHEECGDPVVHRDVKPSNVMLDAEFNPHLGDFGLARLLKNTAGVTTVLAGTLGYMAPELIYTGKATTESDVYSFGVVALEVVFGKRFNNFIGESCLLDFAWDMHAKGTLVECVDPKLNGDLNKDEAVKILNVALACLDLESNSRPKMRKVVTILLNSDEPLIELPTTRPKGVYVSFHGISNPQITSYSNASTSTSTSTSTPLFSLPDYPSSSTNSISG